MAKEIIEDYRMGWDFKKIMENFQLKKRETLDLIK